MQNQQYNSNINLQSQRMQVDPMHNQQRQAILQLIHDYDNGNHKKILIALMSEAIGIFKNNPQTSMEDQRFLDSFLSEITSESDVKLEKNDEEPLTRGNKKEKKSTK